MYLALSRSWILIIHEININPRIDSSSDNRPFAITMLDS
jgi:hypothetical protein